MLKYTHKYTYAHVSSRRRDCVFVYNFNIYYMHVRTHVVNKYERVKICFLNLILCQLVLCVVMAVVVDDLNQQNK